MKKFLVFMGMFLCTVWVSATDLRTALKEAAVRFSSSLKPNTVVAIIGVYSESNELSEFMMDELTAHFIEAKKLTIADRANLEAIKKEISFQLSGEVGDESIQQLGAKIGAETVIKGELKQYGSIYTLTIRALNVKTAAISNMYRVDVELGKMEKNMLAEAVKKQKEASRNEVKSESPIVEKSELDPAVKVGFQNLFFGLGSYFNGYYGDGIFLTVSHLSGWIFLFSGIALKFTVLSPNPDDYIESDKDPDYINDLETVERWERTGIAFISLGVIIEVIAIIYGSVAPWFYKSEESFIAYGNKSGFKLDLVATPKKNVAPQLSYVFRY